LIDRRGRRRASTDGRRSPSKAALAARVYIYARPVEAGKRNKQQFKGIFGTGEGNNEYTMCMRVCVCVCECVRIIIELNSTKQISPTNQFLRLVKDARSSIIIIIWLTGEGVMDFEPGWARERKRTSCDNRFVYA